jgi:hypothetical protein
MLRDSFQHEGGVMSAVWDIELPRIVESDREPRATRNPRQELWNAEIYVQQQIRSLVRRVYAVNASAPVKQVVFTSLCGEMGLTDICKRVGEVLAQRDAGDIAVIGERSELLPAWHGNDARPDAEESELRWIATRVQRNVWLLPPATDGSKSSIQPYLQAIRKEFEYSILVAPPMGKSDDAMVMAQFADGIVLVLAAEHTRRALAREIKLAIDQAGVRLLGAVLANREFPVPERLYRALNAL